MTVLSIYNSAHRAKEVFTPLTLGKVGIYVCGVTVYDYCHIGHARVMVVFDMICRWLKQSGYDVNYVRNFTDVDDKIIQRAGERGIDIEQLTEEMIDAFYQDMDALACKRPTLEPRATQHMANMIAMINTLMEKDYAYLSPSGDVLYAVRKFASYGALSGKNIDDLEAGSRVAVDEGKRDPLDFVLWKQAKPDEPAWDSPWGRGRPGWHIECSAMSCAHLGTNFDIHGGGMDLKFPHHENEIAQAVAATDGTFARYWIHNGFVNINEEKMSKSLGNFFTIRDVLARFHPETVRFFLISTHYRSPLDFSDTALEAAKSGLDRLYETKRRLHTDRINLSASSERIAEALIPDQFRKSMNDDFNTPEALAVLFDVAREINKTSDQDGLLAHSNRFTAMCSLLAIVQMDVDAWFQGVENGENQNKAAQIQAKIDARLEARKGRDFARADAIRDELSAQGIILEDTTDGTIWKCEVNK